jgi:hypothetical protein
MKFVMPILELLFELIAELLFDGLFELLKKLVEVIYWIVGGLARWSFALLRGRRGTVYFQIGKSPGEPAQRGITFSPTRRRDRRRRSSYEVG